MRIRDEALRYMGHRGQPVSPELDALLESCLAEIRQISQPRCVSRSWVPDRSRDVWTVDGGKVRLEGKAIRRHLRDADSVIGIVFTLGIEVDRRIRQHQMTDLTRAAVLDACATAYIEEYADEVCAELEKAVPETSLTFRFSPGYGDLPLGVQRELLTALDAERSIGVTLSQHLLMIPRKSVSAFLGRQKKACVSDRGCRTCDQVNCPYRRTESQG